MKWIIFSKQLININFNSKVMLERVGMRRTRRLFGVDYHGENANDLLLFSDYRVSWALQGSDAKCEAVLLVLKYD